MHIQKIFITALITISVIFLGLQVFEYETAAAGLRAVLLVLLTAFYCVTIENKRKLFFLFLIMFSLAEILNFISRFLEASTNNGVHYFYYSTNILYIVSYILLIVKILYDMNIKETVKKFPVHIIVLLALDVFCVVTVTDTTKGILSTTQYSLEFSYNAVIMLLLTVALINYISREDKKSMNFLIGSIFIVFSEVIQLAYFYVSAINVLNVVCSLFLVIAFVFFYLQARLMYQNNDDITENELYA